ncbi:MAG: hypothetical protein ACI906_000167 [Candidatus Latescibacterota bacterium]|jgi:hypothetical protein
MKKWTLLLVVLAVGWGAYVQAQQRGGRGRGGAPLAALERDWALLSFELKVRGDQAKVLQLAYQVAWDQRKELVGGDRSGNPADMMEQVGTIQGELDGAVNNILAPEQLDMFNSLKLRQGGGGGPGGRGR